MKKSILLFFGFTLSGFAFSQTTNSNPTEIKIDSTYTFANGDKYVGEWMNGKKHGQGTYTWANGDKYVGEFKDSKNHGQGTFTWANGDKYTGEYKDGMKNGQGALTFANGDKYLGEWKDSKQHGQGTHTYANGNKYVGEYKEGERHGQGTFTWANGDKYVGEYKVGKKHGQGTFTWANGDKYVGEYKDDMMTGQGVQTWANGDKYLGEWKDSKQHGQGTFTYGKGKWEGDKYVGEWKDGKRNGQGTYTYANGNKYVGECKDDMMHGQGTYTTANGVKYVGELMNDKMHGQGTYTYANGAIQEGVFENNIYKGVSSVNILPKSSTLIQRDSRDNSIFNSVVIGTQTWTTENLNVSIFRNGDPIKEARTAQEWKMAGENEQPAWCYYNNDPANGAKYGKIYNWYAVNHPRGLAPEGWHVPTETEWSQLISISGSANNLINCSEWQMANNCLNPYGFSAIPGRTRSFTGIFDLPGSAVWWTSSAIGEHGSQRVSLSASVDKIEITGNDHRYGFSVRCLKNTSESPIITNVKHESNILNNKILDKNKVVDADGNVYNTVRIRDKIWITENLKTKHFNNGEPIPYVEEFNKWTQLTSPAYCEPSPYYDNQNEGLLYNHYVVEKGNVCPQGFKVPNLNVIDSMLSHYSGNSFGYFLGGFWRWNGNTVDFDDYTLGKVKGFNSSALTGFNFLSGASRSAYKSRETENGYSPFEGFWLRDRASKFDDEKYSSKVELEWDGVYTEKSPLEEKNYNQSVEIDKTEHIRSGNYIRCYKEYNPTISDDKILSVKDKDGNLYKTVRIANQIWMAEDLKTVPEQFRVVFNDEELEHYSKFVTVFYDNFKSSGPVNYNPSNFEYLVGWKFNFKDVCPQDWHLPDQGEWEIMIRNSNLKDLKSTSGWQIYKRPGYNQTRFVVCSNCKSGSPEYKKICPVCHGNGGKTINTGKYIPEQTTNYNGTNKSGMNIRPYPLYMGDSKFDNNNSKAFYFVKDHRYKGVTVITFGLDNIEIKEKWQNEKNAHIRCIKD